MLMPLRLLIALSLLAIAPGCRALPAAGAGTQAGKPHVVYFLVDDLGFANVGYNNRPSAEPLTPHIDGLHDSGAELTNYYVYRFCSPTRSSFMSGRLPYHVNQENHPPASPGGGVPLGMTTLADKLNASGYRTHQIGKWHCGMSCVAHLPVNRGFTSSFGYLSGAEDHFDDTRSGNVDLWRSSDPAYGENGTVGALDYNTYKFTAEALDIIHAHTPSEPLFIYLAYQNVHGPIQAPDNYTALYDAAKVSFHPRLMCLAMISAVDDSIGRVTAALHERALWNNTLMIFSSDNGGPADHANNWPLRGSKGSDFEGGTRVCAFLNGGYLRSSLRGSKVKGMMHITDWWATLSTLVGQGVADPKAAAAGLPPPDSLDMWSMLTGANATSPRDTLVLRAVPDSQDAGAGQGAIIRMLTLPGAAAATRMKLVTGGQGGYYGGQYAPNNTNTAKLPFCNEGCLFNIDIDPTEHTDLAADPRHASTLLALQGELTTAITTYYQSPGSEAAANGAKLWAKAHGGFWGPWLPGQYVPPPAPPPPPPLPPSPPRGGFILTKASLTDKSTAAAQCLTVLGLSKASHAVYGACDGGSHWAVDSEGGSGGLVNVAAKAGNAAFLRESPASNCSVGNTAQLGVSGRAGEIVTVYDEGAGVLREAACGDGPGGLCLGLVGTSTINLMDCTSAAAKGWRKETAGFRADPLQKYS